MGKIDTYFPYFHLFTPPLLSNEDFYVFQLPLFITTPVPAPPPRPFNKKHLLLERIFPEFFQQSSFTMSLVVNVL